MTQLLNLTRTAPAVLAGCPSSAPLGQAELKRHKVPKRVFVTFPIRDTRETLSEVVLVGSGASLSFAPVQSSSAALLPRGTEGEANHGEISVSPSRFRKCGIVSLLGWSTTSNLRTSHARTVLSATFVVKPEFNWSVSSCSCGAPLDSKVINLARVMTNHTNLTRTAPVVFPGCPSSAPLGQAELKRREAPKRKLRLHSVATRTMRGNSKLYLSVAEALSFSPVSLRLQSSSAASSHFQQP
jgi:hypothetical protein